MIEPLNHLLIDSMIRGSFVNTRRDVLSRCLRGLQDPATIYEAIYK